MNRHIGALVLAALGSASCALGCSENSGGVSGSGAGTSGNSSDDTTPSQAGSSGADSAGGGRVSASGGATSSESGGNASGGMSNASAGATASAGSTGGALSSSAGSGSSSGGAAGAMSSAPEPLSGYTLFSIMDANNDYNQSQLIDMKGNVVKIWNVGGIPSKMLPGGDLIGATGVFPGSYDSVNFLQMGWDGTVRWNFDSWARAGDGTIGAREHHDFQREGNPVGYYAPGQDFVDGGITIVLAHQLRVLPEIRDDALDDDVIYELDGAGVMKATLWQAADHIAEFGFDDAALADIRTRGAGGTLEWLHGNSISWVGPNHWFDEGHTEFDPANIIYSSRNANFVVIIDHVTGNVVWRIGPDFAGRPEEKLGQFAGQHNPHIIPLGLPGAGNMLVFDDGGSSGYGGAEDSDRYSRSWSRVLEFNPITMDIVWQYGSASGPDNMFSNILSNAQRLPNGNTVITIGVPGKVIEVTPDKQIAWQYEYVPAAGNGLNWLYRTYRIPPEWLPSGENAAHGNYPNWGDLYPVR